MSGSSDNFIITYNGFMSIPIRLYKTVGVNLRKLQGSSSFWITLNFWIGFINMNVINMGELITFGSKLGKFANFVEATAIAPCVGFGFLADFKTLTILLNAKRVDEMQDMFIEIFPKTFLEQVRMDVLLYRNRLNKILNFLIIVTMPLIWLFNLSAIMTVVFEMLYRKEEFVPRLPYEVWSPFSVDTKFIYFLAYCSHMLAGHTSMVFTIGADVVLCSYLMQLVMHFDKIADDLKQYMTKRTQKDIEFLINCIKQHQILLRLSDELNGIFSTSVLFNFLASSCIICLVGFQTTAGVNKVEFLKFIFFLVGSLLQIYLICYFGNMLSDSSGNIAQAAYENDWTGADPKYKKMLLIIMTRAQKTSGLKPLMCDEVSLRSFQNVVSTAYQFFAVLRSMYTK